MREQQIELPQTVEELQFLALQLREELVNFFWIFKDFFLFLAPIQFMCPISFMFRFLNVFWVRN